MYYNNYYSDYDELVREHFNISDTKTRKTIIALEGTEQNQLLAALSSALYDKIVAKVDDIDFGTIPRSRGDITKVDGFNQTEECLSIIRQLVLEYHEKTDIVDTVITAISNIKQRKGTFMKGFSLNVEFPIMLYNLIVLAIEQSVSFLIAVSIQYIKDPQSGTINAALDKVAYNNTRDNLLFEQLDKFNQSCITKELDNAIDDIFKNGGKISEAFEADSDDSGMTVVININSPADNKLHKAGPFDNNNVTPKVGNKIGNTISDNKVPVANKVGNDIEGNKVPVANKVGNKIPIAGNKVGNDIEDNKVPVANKVGNDIEGNKLGNKIGNKPVVGNNVQKHHPHHDEDDNDYEYYGSLFSDDDDEDDYEDNCSTVPYKVAVNGDCIANDPGVEDIDIYPEETPIDEKPVSEGVGQDVAKKVGGKIMDLATNTVPGKIAAGATVAVLGFKTLRYLLKVAIPTFRKITYYFYYFRSKLSDCLDTQAQFLELNATKLEYSSTSEDQTEEQKKKIIQKQTKIAEKLRSLSNKIAIKDKDSAKKANKDIEEEKKKTNIDDIKDDLPPEISDKGGLF